MLIKAGVDISRLRPEIRKKLIAIERVVYAVEGEELVITSTYEGNHSASSLHYANKAVDIRIYDEPGTVQQEIQLKLGDDYDVCLGRNCIHIEYDPK